MNTARKFSDVLNLIEKQRKAMFETNPFFKIIANEAFSIEQRILFIPYMLFFSCGGPDVITLLMKNDKERMELNFIEKKIDAFTRRSTFFVLPNSC